MAISVVDVDSHNNHYEDARVVFPSKPLLYVDDTVSLALSDLADNSAAGLAEAVFFSYGTLHEILAGAKKHLSSIEDEAEADNYDLNSRVVSASLGRGRHIELGQAVRIRLRHLEEAAMETPVCVFWDYEVHGWSDSGCHVVASNETYTECECDHLTNFAVLMKPVAMSNANSLLTNVRLDIVAYVVAAVILIALFLLLVKVLCNISL